MSSDPGTKDKMIPLKSSLDEKKTSSALKVSSKASPIYVISMGSYHQDLWCKNGIFGHTAYYLGVQHIVVVGICDYICNVL